MLVLVLQRCLISDTLKLFNEIRLILKFAFIADLGYIHLFLSKKLEIRFLPLK